MEPFIRGFLGVNNFRLNQKMELVNIHHAKPIFPSCCKRWNKGRTKLFEDFDTPLDMELFCLPLLATPLPVGVISCF
jgi:hypothetical protein